MLRSACIVAVMETERRPAWWPTAEQKLHADAGCAHPDNCNVPTEETEKPERLQYLIDQAVDAERERVVQLLAENCDDQSSIEYVLWIARGVR